MNRIASVVAGLSLALVGTSATFAATINVPGDHATIQGAINASSHGDVIAIAAGTYHEHSLNPGGKAITIGSASGNLDVTIDAQLAGAVFVIDSGEGDDTVIKDLVITRGQNLSGGGIHCSGSFPTISGCTIVDNHAYFGGGVYSSINYGPTITNCTIWGNTAAENGGGIANVGGTLTINGSQICSNYPNNIAGGYSASLSCIVGNCDDCALDDDADGIPNYLDQCPNDPDNDIDDDGVCGDVDAFPDDPNEWADSDGDGVGDNEDSAPRGACCVSSGCFDSTDAQCTAAGGTWLSEGGSCDDCPATCAGDANADGVVDVFDLLSVIDGWGTCP